MSVIERDPIPKNSSFNSVTDVLLINLSESDGKASTSTSTTTPIITEQQSTTVAIDNDDNDNDVILPLPVPITINIDESEMTVNVAVLSTTAGSSNTQKSVRFGSIECREYNRIVGDHPDVKVGPPVTFSWEYGTVPSTPIDDYEQQRWRRTLPASSLSSQPQQHLQQRSLGVRRMSSITRKNMLRTLFDVTEEEIVAAEREVQLIQKQRERTLHQSTAGAVVESNLRRTSRKLRKSFSRALSALSTVPIPSYAIPSY